MGFETTFTFIDKHQGGTYSFLSPSGNMQTNCTPPEVTTDDKSRYRIRDDDVIPSINVVQKSTCHENILHEEIIEMTNHKTIKELFQEGMTEFMGQNYEKSVLALSRVIEMDPDNRLAHMSRGAAFLKLNITENAVADFSRAAEIDPEYARAFHLRGLAHEQQGNSEAALDDFTRAIAVDPEYAAAFYSRASLHSKMGNTDLATEDIQMATHLTEVNIETFANENNIWRSQHMKLEETDVADTFDR